MTQHLVSPTGSHRRAAESSHRSAPRPAPRPVERVLFGDSTTIPYRWLRDVTDPEVIAHIAAENAHTDARIAHLVPLAESLSAEGDAPVPPIELSAPVLLGGFWYIDRFEPEGGATLSRVPDSSALRGDTGVPVIETGTLLEGEQILVQDCLGMIGFAISPDHRLVARAEIARGGCHLIITDAETGAVVDSEVTGAGPDLVFSADSRSLVHTRLDDLGRRHEVRAHRLGTSMQEDTLLLEEHDDWADLVLIASRDGSALLIRADSPQGSEAWSLDLHDVGSAPRSLTGRLEPGHPVLLEHAGDRMLVLRQDPASLQCVLSETGLVPTGELTGLTALLTAEANEHFESVEAFADVIALQLRRDGVPRVRLIPRRADGSLDTAAAYDIGRAHELDAVRLEPVPAWTARRLRYRLDSFLTPGTLFEHDLETAKSIELMRQEIPGGSTEQYVEHRLWATSADGTQVPISLIARRDVAQDGTSPALLLGHGEHGTIREPRLRRDFLSLVDRLGVLAIAHVRGSGELGPLWQEQGRGTNTPDSFADFVACAKHVVDSGWAAPDRLGALGLGHGSLLVAGAANLQPSLFRALSVGMTMLDPLETLIDPRVMLSLEEWAEWGDPAEDEATCRSIRAYSPAENIRAEEYPAVFAWTTPADDDAFAPCAVIWIAQLRETTTNDAAERPILLRTSRVSGPGIDPRAESVAWLLEQLGADTLVG